MIEVDHVSRRYGPVLSVDDVSFVVRPGEIVGFLGPNGAGKSTLIRMLATYLEPTSGRIRIAGHDTVSDALGARRSLGYLPEHNALFEAMRVDRFLDFVGRVRGLSREERKERGAWVADRCGLEAVLGKRIRECSKGYRQRLGLAAALLHDPPVILLDEPTHGLDPLQVVAFRSFLHELREGRAILFSSHVLAEVAAISDRLIAIDGGRVVLDEGVPELAARAAREGCGLEALVLSGVQNSRGVARLAPAP